MGRAGRPEEPPRPARHISAGVLSQLEDLPRLVRSRRLAAPLARDARHAADELGVLLGEYAPVVEHVVLEAEAHVAAHGQGSHGHRHVPAADAGAGPVSYTHLRAHETR